MAEELRPNITLDGDISPFRQKLREASEELKRLGNEGESAVKRMTGPLGTLQEKFVAVSAVLAGGKLFSEAVTSAQNLHVEVERLQKMMGISEGVAVSLKYALGDLYVDAGTFDAALGKLVTTINTAPEKFEALGISLVDSKGKTRDMLSVMMDANSKINQFAEGTDRSRAAAYVYSKQWREVQKILELTNERLEEGAAKAQALGINLSANEIKEYRAAMNDANDVTEALSVRIGMALIPILKSMAAYFSEVGGPVINAVIWAFKHLIQFLDETVTMIRLVWNDAKYVFDQLTTAAAQMGTSLAAILQGNVSQAKTIWAEGNRQLEANEKAHLAEYERLNREHAQRIVKLWEPVSEAKSGGKSSGGKKQFNLTENDGKPAQEKSVMDYYEAALASEKNLAAERNALREFSKAQELAFWQLIQQNAEMGAKDRIAVEKKVASLAAEVKREEAKQSKEISDENNRSAVEQAVARVDAEQAAMEALLATDAITKNQALALEDQYEKKRYDIKRAALAEKLALYEADPELNPVEMARIKNQILELESQYQIKKNTLQGKMLLQQKVEAEKSSELWGSFSRSVSSLWDKGTTAMMNGTLRWGNAWRAVWMELVRWFGTQVVGAMLSKWMAAKAAEFAISMGWMTKEQAAKLGMLSAETTAQTAAAVEQGVTQHAVGITGVMSNSAIAATAAMASVAAIPVVGWAMAPGVGAETYALGMAYLASARNGYDIPAGVNPITQLHEKEMVLPEGPADVIRKLAESGGSGGAGGPLAIYLSAMDSRDVKRFLMDNKRELVDAIRSAQRDGKK